MSSNFATSSVLFMALHLATSSVLFMALLNVPVSSTASMMRTEIPIQAMRHNHAMEHAAVDASGSGARLRPHSFAEKSALTRKADAVVDAGSMALANRSQVDLGSVAVANRSRTSPVAAVEYGDIVTLTFNYGTTAKLNFNPTCKAPYVHNSEDTCTCETSGWSGCRKNEWILKKHGSETDTSVIKYGQEVVISPRCTASHSLRKTDWSTGSYHQHCKANTQGIVTADSGSTDNVWIIKSGGSKADNTDVEADDLVKFNLKDASGGGWLHNCGAVNPKSCSPTHTGIISSKDTKVSSQPNYVKLKIEIVADR